jgi:hypothetical protein
MNKHEVEQILILVKAGHQIALSMKIYKNGIVCRQGCGSAPQIAVSAMSFTNTASLFNRLMEMVPQPLLDHPMNYQDDNISSPLEYIIGFYGVSSNGENGERANWTKSTGIRFLLDSNTAFRHTALSFADNFAMEAAEQSNSWYFDVMVNAVYKLKATTLPETIINTPAAENIQADFQNYVSQIRNSARKWDINMFTQQKIYQDGNNNQFAPFAVENEESFKLRFIPIGQQHNQPTDGTSPEKWWKVW